MPAMSTFFATQFYFSSLYSLFFFTLIDVKFTMYHRFIIEQVIGFLYDRDDRKTAAWDFRGQDTVTKPLQVPQSAPRRARPNRPAKSFDGRKKIVRFFKFYV